MDVSVVKGIWPVVLKVATVELSVEKSALSPIENIESATSFEGVVPADDDSKSIFVVSCCHGRKSHAIGDANTLVESVGASEKAEHSYAGGDAITMVVVEDVPHVTLDMDHKESCASKGRSANDTLTACTIFETSDTDLDGALRIDRVSAMSDKVSMVEDTAEKSCTLDRVRTCRITA